MECGALYRQSDSLDVVLVHGRGGVSEASAAFILGAPPLLCCACDVTVRQDHGSLDDPEATINEAMSDGAEVEVRRTDKQTFSSKRL